MASGASTGKDEKIERENHVRRQGGAAYSSAPESALQRLVTGVYQGYSEQTLIEVCSGSMYTIK